MMFNDESDSEEERVLAGGRAPIGDDDEMTGGESMHPLKERLRELCDMLEIYYEGDGDAPKNAAFNDPDPLARTMLVFRKIVYDDDQWIGSGGDASQAMQTLFT
mmetsp:Transcript_29931/g.69956  ORF Transcript_29931/g.69956 Transcript_29931/m.69956 type:complete len:104 (-) Transcript_29931:1951-2262(-)